MVKIKKNISTFHDFGLFTLEYDSSRETTRILMQMKLPLISTKRIPSALNILQKKFPGVLTTRCFNKLNLPFKSEVVKTEIGHLFEHILIEHICHEKIKRGEISAVVNGRTDWNWENDPHGLFRISIDVGSVDFRILENSVKASAKLTNLILNSPLVN